MAFTQVWLEAAFGQSQTGLGTVGYRLYKSDGIDSVARTTSGVVEIGAGVYGVADVSIPDDAVGIEWDTGGGSPLYATEDLQEYRGHGGAVDTVAAAVWDEVLSGALHNVPGSAGRRLRSIQDLGTYEGGAVWVDTVDGVAGTDLYESGVVNNPVDNLIDARIIADAVGLKAFNILSGSEITLDQEYDGFIFEGIGYTVDLNGQSVSGTHFSRALLSGNDSGSNALATRYEMCGIGTMSLGLSIFNRCALQADLTLVEAGVYLLDHCLSAVAGTGSPSMDFGDSGPKQVNMRHYSGGIEVKNMGHVTVHKMSLEGNGQLKINANCTEAIAADQIAIRGNFKVTDYVSGGWGGTISDDARWATDQLGLVWDEILTGSDHNIPTSAGRRMRELAGYVVYSGTAIGNGNGVNQIELNGDASDADGAYDPALISIVDGTGAGQSRLILQYDGATRIATVDRNWKVQPTSGSDFVITGSAGREHVNEGLAQGGTINTITLNTLGSDDDDVYVGQRVFLRSGKGEDQSKVIKAYDGTTKVATLWHDWVVIPDATTGYAMIPDHIIPAAGQIVDGDITIIDAIRVIMAALAGLASGGGGDTISFRNVDDTKTVLQLTVDENGNRSVVVLNP
jgi:hypothetical protein